MILEPDEVFLLVPEGALFGERDGVEELRAESFGLEFSGEFGR